MGCATSKIDDLPAVILCKERLDFLNQALHQRYLLSDCHVSYIHSLTSIGVSLHRFFQSATTLPPPIVTKAPHNDVAHRRSSSSSGGHISLSNSPSGSHLHFHSDSDHDHDHDHLNGHIQDLSDSDSEIHSPRKSNPNPNTNPYEGSGLGSGSGSNGAYPYSYPYTYPHPYQHPYVNNGNGNGNGNYMQMNYMKKHVTPSVRYEQRPVYPETIQQFGEASSSSNYSNTNYGNSYGYMNYGAETSKKAAVVPPPPPPATSTWDFLNPFESIESNYPTAYNNNTPSSRDSREVREEEGIPELEDEDFDHFDKFDNEVVKEVVHGHKKVVLNDNHFEKPSSSGIGGRKSEVESIESDESDDDGIAVEKMGEYEVEVVEKKVVRDDGIKGENSGKGGAGGGYKSVFEVVKEIQVQFERAAACGDQIAKVLEVGKLRYNRKNTAFQGVGFFFG